MRPDMIFSSSFHSADSSGSFKMMATICIQKVRIEKNIKQTYTSAVRRRIGIGSTNEDLELRCHCFGAVFRLAHHAQCTSSRVIQSYRRRMHAMNEKKMTNGFTEVLGERL